MIRSQRWRLGAIRIDRNLAAFHSPTRHLSHPIIIRLFHPAGPSPALARRISARPFKPIIPMVRIGSDALRVAVAKGFLSGHTNPERTGAGVIGF